MAMVVLGLHALRLLLLIALVAPHHYHLGSSGAFTVGVGLTAYTLGLHHAFDADHISAIDNTTRKLIAEGNRPMSLGFFFSLDLGVLIGIIKVFRQMRAGSRTSSTSSARAGAAKRSPKLSSKQSDASSS